MALLLGVDLGTRRVGLATCDPALGFALPRDTIEVSCVEEAVTKIEQAARGAGATEIVLGQPVNMDGSLGPAARHAESVARALAQRLGIPVHLWDERLTTHEAHDMLRDAGKSSRKRKGVVDRVAAQLILQSYIDAHPSS